VGADESVGMLGMPGDEGGKRGGGRLDATIAVVAQDVDGPRREMSRTHALRHHAHPRSLLREPSSSREPGHARADDHDVVPHRPARSTSSTPWKIHSWRRICRSWSPYR